VAVAVCVVWLCVCVCGWRGDVCAAPAADACGCAAQLLGGRAAGDGARRDAEVRGCVPCVDAACPMCGCGLSGCVCCLAVCVCVWLAWRRLHCSRRRCLRSHGPTARRSCRGGRRSAGCRGAWRLWLWLWLGSVAGLCGRGELWLRLCLDMAVSVSLWVFCRCGCLCAAVGLCRRSCLLCGCGSFVAVAVSVSLWVFCRCGCLLCGCGSFVDVAVSVRLCWLDVTGRVCRCGCPCVLSESLC
jgi:hypothetical protein